MTLEFADQENALVNQEEDDVSSLLLDDVYSDFENVDQPQSKAEKANLPSEEDIKVAIQKLGSSVYKERVKAYDDLEKMGNSAFPALVKALKNTDLEIKDSAKSLVRKCLENSDYPIDPSFLGGVKLETYGDCLNVMRCADSLNNGELKQLRNTILADPEAKKILSESVERWEKILKIKERLEGLGGLHENGIEETMQSLTDDQVKYLTGLKNLSFINLSSAIHLTDEGIAHLKNLSKLETITLRDVVINDKSLEHLSQLPNLSSLDLARSKFTDHGLEYLNKLPNLKRLNLDGTAITDKSIEQLLQSPKLEAVSLRGTAVTDKGLMLLTKLPHLESIAILEGKITEDGIKQFKAKMPNIRVGIIRNRD